MKSPASRRTRARQHLLAPPLIHNALQWPAHFSSAIIETQVARDVGKKQCISCKINVWSSFSCFPSHSAPTHFSITPSKNGVIRMLIEARVNGAIKFLLDVWIFRFFSHGRFSGSVFMFSISLGTVKSNFDGATTDVVIQMWIDAWVGWRHGILVGFAFLIHLKCAPFQKEVCCPMKWTIVLKCEPLSLHGIWTAVTCWKNDQFIKDQNTFKDPGLGSLMKNLKIVLLANKIGLFVSHTALCWCCSSRNTRQCSLPEAIETDNNLIGNK